MPGKPLYIEHNTEKEPAGHVVAAKVFNDQLWVAVLPSEHHNGKIARAFMGEGTDLPKDLQLKEFSMGMRWIEAPDHNKIGKKVANSGTVHEISLVHTGGYDNTQIHGSMTAKEFMDQGGLDGLVKTVAAAASGSNPLFSLAYSSVLLDKSPSNQNGAEPMAPEPNQRVLYEDAQLIQEAGV